MYELIGDGIVGIIAGIAAWKAKKANDQVQPNGTGKSLTTLLEELTDKAVRAEIRSADLVEWQVEHELRHDRLGHRFIPLLEQMLVDMDTQRTDMGQHRDATEDDR